MEGTFQLLGLGKTRGLFGELNCMAGKAKQAKGSMAKGSVSAGQEARGPGGKGCEKDMGRKLADPGCTLGPRDGHFPKYRTQYRKCTVKTLTPL